jgi:hypothetical protein
MNLRMESGSLFPYGSDQGQVSSNLRRAADNTFLKFLCSMDLLNRDNMSIDMDVSSGKWSVVLSVSTLMVATRSLDTHMWSRMDLYSLVLPSSITCRPWDLYVITVSKYLKLASATAVSWASMRHLGLYLTLNLLAVSRFTLHARTTLSTYVDAACNCSLTLDRADISRTRSDHSL